MANFIFNSARRLFSEAKINWIGANTAALGDYTIKAAMVNKTGGSGIMNYSPPADTSNDSVQFVEGTTGSRNMYTDFGMGNTPANSSLVRNASDQPIVDELLTRAFVSTTSACDSADITFQNVPVNPLTGTYGAIEGIVVYLQRSGVGVDSPEFWPVLLFLDNLTTGAMSVTPNGGDIVVQWSTSGIFRL